MISGALRGGVGVATIAVMLFAGCKSSDSESAAPSTAFADPWRTPVRYMDTDRRFELDFPSEPELSSKPDGTGAAALVIHTLHSTAGADWSFDLAWSDAPPNTSLVASQTIRPGTAEVNAAGDNGAVTDQHTVKMFGRDALDFTIQGRAAGMRLYRDRQVVVGGRLYELTVTQRAGDRAAFDRFVDSFELLEPPVREDADFFAEADRICESLLTKTPPPANATAEQRGAAASRTADELAAIARRLAMMSASPGDQGDAEAMIDAFRRSVAPARRFADAVSRNAPNASELDQRTRGDTDLVDEIAGRHDAGSCT